MLLYMGYKIRIAKLRIEHGITWVLVSVGLVIIAIWPEIIYAIGSVFGIISPVNLVYLVIIAFLLLAVFHNSIRISMLESRVMQLTQEIALRDERFIRMETEDQRYQTSGREEHDQA